MTPGEAGMSASMHLLILAFRSICLVLFSSGSTSAIPSASRQNTGCAEHHVQQPSNAYSALEMCFQEGDFGWKLVDNKCCCVGQSLSQLIEMEKELKKELESGGAQDPEFNAAVLKRLAPHKARAELRDIHSMLLSRQRTQGAGKAPGLQRSGWRDEVRLILPFPIPPNGGLLVPVRFIPA